MSLTLNFKDKSIAGPSGPITGWAWNFDDPGSGGANTSSSQNPTHTFTSAGTYDVTLTVTGTSPDGTDSVTNSVTVSASPPVPPSGSALFDGRAVLMSNLESHIIATVPPNSVPSVGTYTTAITQSGVTRYYYINQTPAIWTAVTFIKDDISLVSDANYTKVYNVSCEIGDSSPWLPAGSFASTRRGSCQITKRRSIAQNQVDYYSCAVKINAWSGNPSQIEWSDILSLGYQTSSGDQLRLGWKADTSGRLAWCVGSNAGYANNTTSFAHGTTEYNLTFKPVTFSQWEEFIIGVKWSTYKVGFVKVWNRPLGGGSWSLLFDKENIDTQLYGNTTYGTFPQTIPAGATVIDKFGMYYGRFDIPNTQVFKSFGFVRCPDFATAESFF